MITHVLRYVMARILLVHDRLLSAAFGRPCTIHEEE